MAQFSVNASRFDPYKNFKFRVKWDGRYVAGISKVQIDELKRQGFTGHISIEYEANWDNSVPDVKKCVEFVRDWGAGK